MLQILLYMDIIICKTFIVFYLSFEHNRKFFYDIVRFSESWKSILTNAKSSFMHMMHLKTNLLSNTMIMNTLEYICFFMLCNIWHKFLAFDYNNNVYSNISNKYVISNVRNGENPWKKLIISNSIQFEKFHLNYQVYCLCSSVDFFPCFSIFINATPDSIYFKET